MAVAKPAQVAGHQHQIGRGQRHIGASRSHRDTHGAGTQCQGVVDPVADHQRPAAGAGLRQHRFQLLFRQRLRPYIGDAEKAADAGGDGSPVAGQQHLPIEAHVAQFSQRLTRLRPWLIRQQQPAEEAAVARHAGHRAVMRGRRRRRDGKLCEQLGAAQDRVRPVRASR